MGAMTVNPVDLQVLLPQVGQINKIQRVQENQQQMDQQILGQLNQQELRNKQNVIKKSHAAEQNKVKKENEGKKKENKRKDRIMKGTSDPQELQESPSPSPADPVGSLFDITI